MCADDGNDSEEGPPGSRAPTRSISENDNRSRHTESSDHHTGGENSAQPPANRGPDAGLQAAFGLTATDAAKLTGKRPVETGKTGLHLAPSTLSSRWSKSHASNVIVH